MLHVNACAFVVAIEAQAKPKLAICCSVMAGLVPAIHVFCTVGDKNVDAQDKPGHDGDPSRHLRQPRRIAGHQVDLDIDLAVGTPAADRRDRESMRDDQH
jgi:hypothetical protein